MAPGTTAPVAGSNWNKISLFVLVQVPFSLILWLPYKMPFTSSKVKPSISSITIVPKSPVPLPAAPIAVNAPEPV